MKNKVCRGRIAWMAGLLVLVANITTVAAQESPKREDIEWLDVWIPDTNESGLPRVLLVGNSITRQYGGEVEKQLEGKAFVARLSTSKSLGDPGLLQEVVLVMSYLDFDVVHFNNGMHGFDYSEQEWGAALPGLLETIREHAPDAKLIWAHTTPYRSGDDPEQFAPRNERVLERNRIATEFFKDKDVAINDLYSVLSSDPSYYGKRDGVHPLPAGVKALADRVADRIDEVLSSQK